MLPLVSRIVRDILDHYREWQQTVEGFEMATALSRADRPSAEADVLQRRAQELAREIQGFLAELTSLGVEFKGFELGLVDFPGDIDGQQILWCWKYGEPSVLYWHDAVAGYAGRQPVEALLASTRNA
ncbi:MAG: DUF2203 domain-containing protein [Gemmatimonadaceae bacterium]